MAIFQFFKMAAVSGGGEISTSGPIRRPNMRQHAKFSEDRSNHSGDMADCRDIQYTFSQLFPVSSGLAIYFIRENKIICVQNRSFPRLKIIFLT